MVVKKEQALEQATGAPSKAKQQASRIDQSSKGSETRNVARKKSKAPSNEALRKAGADYARKKVDKLFSQSALGDCTTDFPMFALDELKMGRLLGKGGFGTVHEIRGFTVVAPKNKRQGKFSARSRRQLMVEEDAVAEDGFESRLFIAEHCIRTGGDARYAVKFLSPEVIANPAMYIQGITDMAVETRFLSSIEHPNIVKMRATSSQPYNEKYFIVMDRLYDTLEKRIVAWSARHKRCTGMSGRLTDRDGSKAKALLEERLLAAYDLSDAIAYLHKRRIVYRDTKPENIGFDIHDDIKIFDFGLSKELTQDMVKDDNGLYKLTGLTGTIRYMAPEVGLEEPYDEKCDVYSLSILVWEMLSLKHAYANYFGTSAFQQKIFKGKKRPPLPDSWSKPISLLLHRGWDWDLSARHSSETFSAALRAELVRVRDGDESGLEHVRRRSTFVFRQDQ